MEPSGSVRGGALAMSVMGEGSVGRATWRLAGFVGFRKPYAALTACQLHRAFPRGRRRAGRTGKPEHPEGRLEHPGKTFG